MSAATGVSDAMPDPAPRRVPRGWRRPLLHFIGIGVLLFGAERAALHAGWIATGTLVVTDADRLRLRQQWQQETGRVPTPDELRASLRRDLDERLLIAEALRLRLDRDDAVVQRRLSMNMAFAAGRDADGAVDAQAIADAQALQMPTRDAVTRRRLMQQMEQRLLPVVRFSDAELDAYIDAHAADYAQPPRYAFELRHFAAERGDAAARAAAQAALHTADPGDPLLIGLRQPLQARSAIAMQFGEALAQAVVEAAAGHPVAGVVAADPAAGGVAVIADAVASAGAAPPRGGADTERWQGPLRTPYGWALVRVTQHQPSQPPDRAAVRNRAAAALVHEREQAGLQQRLQRLRDRYRVVGLEALP